MRSEKGWIWPWFSPKISEVAASAKAIVMHKVTPATFQQVTTVWNVSQPAPPIGVDCSQTCAQWGWRSARVPCDAEPTLPASSGWQGFQTSWNGSLCPFDPATAGFRCCFLRSYGKFRYNMTHDRELSLELLRSARRRRRGRARGKSVG